MPSAADDSSPLIDWQDGQPVSRRFGDVYFSRDSGREETRHVFLEGNRLRERWAALTPRARFTIGETGFGTGLNFACAWALWDELAPPDARLRYVSVERHPLAPADIARTLGMWPELVPRCNALLAQWSELPPGWHRFVLGGGRVLLTILAGDVRAILPRLDARVDAWFLDGFAPAKNPEMWQPDVLARVADLSASGATCATYSVAGEVRDGLEAAGFAIEKTRGFGRKREMLRGVLGTRRRSAWTGPWFARPVHRIVEREAIVIGAGLAGTSTAASLAARGWTITLLDRHETLAAEASGNPQGALYGRLSPHATVLSELTKIGLEYTARSLPALGLERGVDFDPCGVLQLEYDESERVRQSRLADQDWPAGFLARLDRAEASARVGIAMPSGGLLFPRAGWVRPPVLCRALATRPSVRLTLGRAAVNLRRSGFGWEVHDEAGPIASAPFVVIAVSGASATFAETAHLPLRLIRGQLTLVPESPGSRPLRTVLCGEGYIAPAIDGAHSLGASHKFRDPSTGVTTIEHAENLAKLARLAPALYAALGGDQLDPGRLAGRAALRCSSPDYLPIVGPVVDATRFTAAYARLSYDATLELDAPAPWLDGLYVNTAHGSRGLVTAPISGELLAAYLDDEPAPLPISVMQAVHPSRFLLRSLIRRRA
jgi:tRNA 5-methylaminomethyl-2-thiouridine biosynthesis bifunctional protein